MSKHQEVSSEWAGDWMGANRVIEQSRPLRMLITWRIASADRGKF